MTKIEKAFANRIAELKAEEAKKFDKLIDKAFKKIELWLETKLSDEQRELLAKFAGYIFVGNDLICLKPSADQKEIEIHLIDTADHIDDLNQDTIYVK